MLFSFRYEKMYRRIGGIYAGFCLTSIFYFLIMKGAKGASFMTPELLAFLHGNTTEILLTCFIGLSALFQILIWFFNYNALRDVILAGTFALAFAFAGNDLVNFVGVPIAAMQSAEIASASGVAPDQLFMGELAIRRLPRPSCFCSRVLSWSAPFGSARRLRRWFRLRSTSVRANAAKRNSSAVPLQAV